MSNPKAVPALLFEVEQGLEPNGPFATLVNNIIEQQVQENSSELNQSILDPDSVINNNIQAISQAVGTVNTFYGVQPAERLLVIV